LLIGSATLARSLIELDLIDEFRLMIDPLLVGGGKRLFPEDGALRPLELLESEVVSTGATLATYAPRRRVKRTDPFGHSLACRTPGPG
jgi:dihydrofolate reductase